MQVGATKKRKSGTQVRRASLCSRKTKGSKVLFWERFPNRDANLEAIHKNILSEE